MARIDRDVRGLFHLARAIAGTQAADIQQLRWILAATASLGTPASDLERDLVHAGLAGIGGLARTLALEWPAVTVRALGIDNVARADLMDVLRAEVGATDGLVEVRYEGSRRLTPRPVSVSSIGRPAPSSSPGR